MRQLRQGDILIERLEGLPDDHGSAEPGSGGAMAVVVVLAEGEASGHAHRLVAPAGGRFTRAIDPGDPLAVGVAVLEGPATVTHDEHAPVTLPPGVWRFTRQRRFDPRTRARLAGD